MSRGSGVLAALLVVAVSGGLTGCVGQHSCRDFITLDSPAERAAGSQLVVDADVRATDRTVDVEGVYRVHVAEVTAVSKGSAPSGTLDVFSPADQCTTSGQPVEYLDADPLQEDGAYRLYLYQERPDLWRLIVPSAADPRNAD